VDKGIVHTQKLDAIRKKYKLSKDDTVLLSLGRVAKEKNIDLIIDALPFVLEYVPTAKLVIAGDFSYRKTLEEKVKAMDLDKSVIFTGRIPMKDRWDIFALADIFCFPSLTDTQALVVNEAALMSLPIVWCDEDVNQVLIHQKSGLKSANSPSAYAKALIDLAQDKQLRIQYGKNAKKLAHTYSEENQTKKLLSVLEKLHRTTGS